MVVEHPNTLLHKPKAVWFCNLLEQAAYITNTDTEVWFDKPYTGIYMKGHAKPIITLDKPYYFSEVNERTRVTDLSTILSENQDILDSDGGVVIYGTDLKRRSYLYTTEPELPISAMYVAYNIIIDYLYKYCRYARGLKKNSIEQCIKPEYQHLFDLSLIEDLLSDVLDELHDFIKHDDWFIYFHKLHTTTLIIEKACDYRIYEWTRMMYEQQEEQLDNY